MTGQLELELFAAPARRPRRRATTARAVPPAYYGTKAYGWAYSPRRGHLARVRTVRVRLGGLL